MTIIQKMSIHPNTQHIFEANGLPLVPIQLGESPQSREHQPDGFFQRLYRGKAAPLKKLKTLPWRTYICKENGSRGR
jgi:hypothetical protein